MHESACGVASLPSSTGGARAVASTPQPLPYDHAAALDRLAEQAMRRKQQEIDALQLRSQGMIRIAKHATLQDTPDASPSSQSKGLSAAAAAGAESSNPDTEMIGKCLQSTRMQDSLAERATVRLSNSPHPRSEALEHVLSRPLDLASVQADETSDSQAPPSDAGTSCISSAFASVNTLFGTSQPFAERPFRQVPDHVGRFQKPGSSHVSVPKRGSTSGLVKTVGKRNYKLSRRPPSVEDRHRRPYRFPEQLDSERQKLSDERRRIQSCEDRSAQELVNMQRRHIDLEMEYQLLLTEKATETEQMSSRLFEMEQQNREKQQAIDRAEKNAASTVDTLLLQMDRLQSHGAEEADILRLQVQEHRRARVHAELEESMANEEAKRVERQASSEMETLRQRLKLQELELARFQRHSADENGGHTEMAMKGRSPCAESAEEHRNALLVQNLLIKVQRQQLDFDTSIQKMATQMQDRSAEHDRKLRHESFERSALEQEVALLREELAEQEASYASERRKSITRARELQVELRKEHCRLDELQDEAFSVEMSLQKRVQRASEGEERLRAAQVRAGELEDRIAHQERLREDSEVRSQREESASSGAVNEALAEVAEMQGLMHRQQTMWERSEADARAELQHFRSALSEQDHEIHGLEDQVVRMQEFMHRQQAICDRSEADAEAQLDHLRTVLSGQIQQIKSLEDQAFVFKSRVEDEKAFAGECEKLAASREEEASRSDASAQANFAILNAVNQDLLAEMASQKLGFARFEAQAFAQVEVLQKNMWYQQEMLEDFEVEAVGSLKQLQTGTLCDLTEEGDEFERRAKNGRSELEALALINQQRPEPQRRVCSSVPSVAAPQEGDDFERRAKNGRAELEALALISQRRLEAQRSGTRAARKLGHDARATTAGKRVSSTLSVSHV